MTFAATILTLYPEMFPGPLGVSLAGGAMAESILPVAFLWLIAPFALLWVMLRATRGPAADSGQLRYLAVAVSVPFALAVISYLFPEPSADRYPHLTPVGMFVGIPATIYLLAAHLVFAARALRGLVK